MINRKVVRTFAKNRLAVVGLFLIGSLLIVSVAAPWLAPHDPSLQNVQELKLVPPRQGYLLGTDLFGRDLLSRIIWASRISLLVGASSVALGLFIGAPLGIIAAYRQGTVGSLIMRVVDILLSFPSLILGVAVVAVLGGGLDKVVLTIGLLMIPKFARMSYGPSLSWSETDSIEAARAIGASPLRIVVRHIFPNILGDLVVMASLWIGSAIRLESAFSFLGLGVAPPTPTWGNLCRAGMDHMENAPWLFFFPGLAIVLAVFAFNLLGDGLRDVSDPQLTE